MIKKNNYYHDDGLDIYSFFSFTTESTGKSKFSRTDLQVTSISKQSKFQRLTS